MPTAAWKRLEATAAAGDDRPWEGILEWIAGVRAAVVEAGILDDDEARAWLAFHCRNLVASVFLNVYGFFPKAAVDALEAVSSPSEGLLAIEHPPLDKIGWRHLINTAVTVIFVVGMFIFAFGAFGDFWNYWYPPKAPEPEPPGLLAAAAGALLAPSGWVASGLGFGAGVLTGAPVIKVAQTVVNTYSAGQMHAVAGVALIGTGSALVELFAQAIVCHAAMTTGCAADDTLGVPGAVIEARRRARQALKAGIVAAGGVGGWIYASGGGLAATLASPYLPVGVLTGWAGYVARDMTGPAVWYVLGRAKRIVDAFFTPEWMKGRAPLIPFTGVDVGESKATGKQPVFNLTFEEKPTAFVQQQSAAGDWMSGSEPFVDLPKKSGRAKTPPRSKSPRGKRS